MWCCRGLVSGLFNGVLVGRLVSVVGLVSGVGHLEEPLALQRFS